MPFRWRRDNKPRHEPTAAERAAFDEMLLGQDLESAEVQAYEYAFRLTRRNPAMAKQLVLQARTRLWERCTFDPKKAPLGAFLCGVVRSVWSTEARRAVTQREREVEYLTEVDTLEGSNAKSPEDLHVARDESTEARDEAARELDELRAHFVDTGDEVNLLWLQYSLDGIDDLPEMVAKSGRKVEEFYRARDRRVRYVKRRRENPPEKT